MLVVCADNICVAIDLWVWRPLSCENGNGGTWDCQDCDGVWRCGMVLSCDDVVRVRFDNNAS